MNDFPRSWKLKTQTVSFGEIPRIMGIVNVTPDSFSDGGQFQDCESAVRQALKLVDQGADILDVGGESTRPGSTPVGVSEELDRVIPVIEKLTKETPIPVSIDTSKSVVAAAALDAGAEIINDVTGLQGDPKMISVAQRSAAGICAMHMAGDPQTMQDNPVYDDVVENILQYLQERRDTLIDQGIDRERICLDPGIGFGKTHEHNLQLLQAIDRFHETGCPIIVGHSRKGFIKKFSGDPSDSQIAGTLAVSLWLANARIQILRVHDVLETRQGLLTQYSIHRQASPSDKV